METYEEMLKQGKEQLPTVSSGSERFEIPKVKGHVEGNKTVINNFFQIAQALGRDERHLLKYVLKELATPGDIVNQLVIFKSKIPSAKINEKIQQYANEYVICKECGKPDTKIYKEEEATYMRCQACGAKHPVASRI